MKGIVRLIMLASSLALIASSTTTVVASGAPRPSAPLSQNPAANMLAGAKSCSGIATARAERRAYLTLVEARACEPKATLATDGHMRKDGLYIVALGSGYALAARSTQYAAQPTNSLDALASSYQWVQLSSSMDTPLAGFSMASGNDVWWGTLADASASTRWISWNCTWNVASTCGSMSRGWFYAVYPYYINPWGDGTIYAFGGAGAVSMGCRHYINAAEQWTDAWCYQNG